MRIYFLTYSYEEGINPDIGGFRKLWEIADRLKKQGHSVRIFVPRMAKYKPLKEIPYTTYPLFNFSGFRGPSAYLSMFFFALAAGMREKPDIIYFRTSVNILPVILAKLISAKAVLEVNAAFRDLFQTIKFSRFKYLLHFFSEKFNALFSYKIIALTVGLKEELIKSYGILPDKIHVVASGTDSEHFLPLDTQECKKRIGINTESTVIGFAGIFYPHQGVDNLIYAARHVLKIFPRAIFLIVGEGVMKKAWQQLAQSENVDKSFIFTGQIPYEKMPIYFNAMDICVAPFLANRGHVSPLKVLDALACAKPVIASEIPSLRQLFSEFNGSIITVPGNQPEALSDAVIQLAYASKNRKEELGAKARAIIQRNYSWEHIANEISAMLK